jgi:hypothetical protein
VSGEEKLGSESGRGEEGEKFFESDRERSAWLSRERSALKVNFVGKEIA